MTIQEVTSYSRVSQSENGGPCFEGCKGQPASYRGTSSAAGIFL